MKKIIVLTILVFSLQINAKPCKFCDLEIVTNHSIFENKYFNILLDLEPRVPGHLLVIPKRHIAKAHELSQNEWTELYKVIPKIVKVFKKFLETDDYIILEKNGKNAFQQIPHVHFHLFPIHSEKWSDIFDIVPDKLSIKDLEQQIYLFRRYFDMIK